MTNKLGTLEKVELRNIWESESTDFTPWLAREENIQLLGKTIGIDLVVENVEQEVGPFRADILCKDEATDNFVVIENQLEKTNHKHLGQILTYATGTKAVNIVWIASEFTGEHRATLDWLNSRTDDNFNLFGIEVELYKISDSPVAPHFKIICQPNDWSKSINTAGRVYSNGNISSAKQKHLIFWTKLASKMRESDTYLKPRKPRAQHWFNTSIGKSDFNLVSTINTLNNTIGAKLYIRKDKEAFKVLQSNKDEIEKELGEELTWEFKPNKTCSTISLYKEKVFFEDTDDCEEIIDWFLEKLKKLHLVFSKRIKNFDSSEYKEVA